MSLAISALAKGRSEMPKKTQKDPSKWGKGKTDPDTWWTKGCASPNASGRPKGSKNQKTIWQESSAIKVEVNIDGKPAKMPKKEVKYHQLNDKAAKGDLKAIGMANELDAKFDPVETVPPTAEESAADFDTLEVWVKVLETFKVFKAGPDEDGGSGND
jgi:hypothetical protein